ncbi:MAG: efflux RND transporter periplasmic adaptor subunit [Gammaproteobacteria bacterium]
MTITFSVFAAQAGMPSMPPAPVEVFTVEQQSWQPELKATGTLTASRGVMLRAEITGRITKILFTPGQLVDAGVPLVQLNPAILQAQLDSAKAQLTLSELNHQRMMVLFKKNTIAKADLDKSEATLKSDQAQVNRMQAYLDQTLIKAPFEGRAGLNLVHLGDYVAAGQDLVSLQDLDPIRADFSVPEAYAGKIAVGQTVQVKTALYPGQIFTGKLAEIDSVISSTTRTLAVRAHIPNKEHKLLPGAFVDIALFWGEKQNVFFVPQTAIVFDATGNYVYKIIDKKAVKTIIKLDVRNGDRVMVKEGLKIGDSIITSGQNKLHDGTAVVLEAKK